MQTGPRTFDDAKLAMMVEPLTIRLEKIKSGQRTPLPVPSPEDADAPPGTGWTKDDVRGFEQYLVTTWAGGGFYEITVTDSTVPTPVTMKWNPNWDTKEYPELIPPPLQEARAAGTAPMPATAQPSSSPQQVNRMAPVFPNGFPNVTPIHSHQQQMVPQQPFGYGMPNYGMGAPPPVSTPAFNQWQHEVDKRKMEDELNRLREQAATREREAAEARHKAELEKIRAENEGKSSTAQRALEAQMSDLRNIVQALASSVKDASARPVGPDPAVLAMQEQTRMLAKQLEDEKREREREARERENREAIQRSIDESNRRFELAQQQHREQLALLQQQIAAQNNSKPDQLFLFMQEQSRQHNDALKEIARQNTDAMQRMQPFMMNPRDMIDLAQRSSTAQEQATERAMKFFGTVIDTQQKVTENLLQMQPSGSPVPELIGNGIAALKDVGEKIASSRGMNERFALQAQAEVAQSQARAMEAQAAMTAMAQGHQVVVTPPPAPQGQLAGPAPTNAAHAPAPMGPEPKRLGRTDREWFSVAATDVEAIREQANVFVRAVSAEEVETDKDGFVLGFSPEYAAWVIARAVQQIAQMRLSIPAVVELAAQKRYADFVDVVLPDAGAGYRAEVTPRLIEYLTRMAADSSTPLPEPKRVHIDDIVEEDDEGEGEGEGDKSDPEPAPVKANANGKATGPKIVPAGKKPQPTTH